jgi:putative SOS response-associated peptidase YedK
MHLAGMCGRYVLKRKDLEELLRTFGIRSLEEFHTRFNIAPTTTVPGIRARDAGAAEAVGFKWGLVPSWSRDPNGGARLANARAEGIAAKSAFRHAFRRKRCLVPASGFYEWQTIGRGKQPWFFARRDEQPFVFAGLWESWRGVDGVELETCALITTEPNDLVRRIHDRMPVILSRSDAEVWLDPRVTEPERLAPLLRPYPAAEMKGTPVSPRVNSVMNDDPGCIEPVALPPAGDPPPSQLSLGL